MNNNYAQYDYELRATVLLKKGTLSLKDIPDEQRSPWLCKIAVQYQNDAIQYVPEHLKTPEIWITAVHTAIDHPSYQYNGLYIGNKPEGKHLKRLLNAVPDNLKTLDFWLEVMRKNGELIQYVPDIQRTAEICLAAVKNFVQDKKEKFYLREWNDKDWKHFRKVFNAVPETVKTSGFWLSLIQQKGGLLQQLSDNQKTPEMCLAAVQDDDEALQYVPVPHRTSEICLAAIHTFIRSKDSSYHHQWTDKDWEEIKQLINAVPDAVKTSEFWLTVIQWKPELLRCVPEEQKTYTLSFTAVQKNGDALKYVPEDQRTSDLCGVAVQSVIDAINSENKSSWGIIASLSSTDLNRIQQVLKAVPEKVSNREFCLKLVQQRGELLQCVANDLRDMDMCLPAVQQDYNALNYVPKALQDNVKAQIHHRKGDCS
jgi:hypothetical protein